MVEAELRTKLENFEEFSGHRFEDITNGEGSPGGEEDPVEEETVVEPSSGPRETHPTGGRRVFEKPRLLLTILTRCTIKIRSC